MSYSIDIDPAAQDTISSLPPGALIPLAEALAMVELTPWSGRSVNPERDPDAAVRNLPFGASGMITYLILDRDQRVDVLLITWP